MKRSKNIFNSPIAPQSLLEDEGNRQFQIGGVNIASNWLVNTNPADYKKYILSALYLSELQRQLSDLKQQSHKSYGNMKQSNLFKIGNVKKKIDNFTVVQIQDEQKPLGDDNLIKNEPPQTSEMKMHKIGGFFKGIIQRKCKIQDKQLYIESQKDDKSPWITIGIAKYTLELELKQHSLTANRQQFRDFVWPQNQNSRLLLWGKQLKAYCIYGKQDELKKFQRYFQVENIQLKQLGVFKRLDTQFQQKIITLFGNKVRFYDHNLRQRRAQKEVQYHSINKNRSAYDDDYKKHQTIIKPIKEITSEMGQSSEVGQSSQLGQSGKLDPGITQSNMIEKSHLNTSSQIILQGFKSPEKNKQAESKEKKKGGSQIFKLKVKSSVVFYDEIEQPLHFQDQGNYSIADLKLNLRQQIGISDVEQESFSVMSNKLGKTGKKVVHMSLKNALDQSQKFNINIHEASSLKHEGQRQNISQIGSLSADMHSLSQKRSKKSLSISQINDPQQNRYKMRKSSVNDSMLDQFQLQRFRPDIDDNDYFESQKIVEISQKENVKERPKFYIKDFKKKKQGEIQIVQKIKPSQTYFAIHEIQMLVPYHIDKINFQILQIDPNLQIQRKIVVCSRAIGCFEQQKGTAPKYTHFSIPGGFKFQVSKQSDQFMFVLIEQGKNHYLRFAVDPKPKYQRNCSQLLITQLDKDGFPFACSLIMFASPNPIELKPLLSTIQFMQRYLTQGQDYDFKLDFIDDKRKRFLIKKQWNKYFLKNIVKNGDADAFAKAVFLGMPESIFSKMKNGLDYNSSKLFNFNQNELRMMEENISSAGIMDLRVFMKPSALIKHASETAYNKCLKERLQQVYVYFLKRYGSTRNLALVFIKQILSKLEPIILMGRRQEEVYALINLYFQVEYEIDELFMQISKYFKK